MRSLVVFAVLVASSLATADIYQHARKYTVRIENRISDVWVPEDRGGIGTGIIVRLDETGGKGMILTNKHVIARRTRFDARQVTLHFDTIQGGTRPVVAEVVAESPLMDLAWLEFPLSEVGGLELEVAPLATAREMNALSTGRTVITYGNSVGLRNVGSEGQISSLDNKPYIQVEAAVNPGNSGGPLIDKDTGRVIGVVTLKVTGADVDNVGFAQRIDLVREEFSYWQRSKRYLNFRHVLTRYGLKNFNELRVTGDAQAIVQSVPDYFERYGAAIYISNPHPDSGLEMGDIILKVNGQLVGGSIRDFLKLIHRHPRNKILATVIRDGKAIDITMTRVQRNQVHSAPTSEFVQLSGLLFTDMDPFQTWLSVQGQSSVVLSDIMPGRAGVALAHEGLIPGSVVTAIRFGGKEYKIEKLAHMVRALKNHDGSSPIRVTYLPLVSLTMGQQEVSRKEMQGTLLYDGSFTHESFRLDHFLKVFDFSGQQPQNRLWQTFVCSGQLGAETQN